MVRAVVEHLLSRLPRVEVITDVYILTTHISIEINVWVLLALAAA